MKIIVSHNKCFFPKIVFLSILLLAFASVTIHAQNVVTLPAPVIEKEFYILSLPSNECVNCKAVTPDILKYFDKYKKGDSLLILTDNDAGAYYIDDNPGIQKKYPVIIDKELSQLVSSDSKASLCYRGYNFIKTVKTTASADVLFKALDSDRTKDKSGTISPIRQDSVKLKYNIFGSFANSIIQTKDNNILLFSKTSNAGCLLIPTTDSITKLIKADISTNDYDAFVDIFKAKPDFNVTQKKVRDFATQTGIPTSCIYFITQTQSKSIAYFSFFTAHSDTIRKDSISVRLKYNVGIAKSNSVSAEAPLDLGSYQTIMPLQEFVFKGVTYQMRTALPIMVVDGDHIFLPCSPGKKDQEVADSVIYLVKFKLNTNSLSKPLSVLKYAYGTYIEECIVRSLPGQEPILLNKIKNIMDFGSSGRSIDLKELRLPGNNDTISIVYDYRAMKDGSIHFVASTTNKLTIAAVINNGKIETAKILDVPEPPIDCKLLPDERLVAINSKGKYLTTRQFEIPFWK